MAQNLQNTIRIPFVSDETLLAFFQELVLAFPPSQFSIDAPGVSLGGPWNRREALDQHIPGRDWSKSHIISSGWARLLSNAITVNFHRYLMIGQQQTASMYENEIFVERNSDVPVQTALKLLDIVNRFREKLVVQDPANLSLDSSSRDVASRNFAQLSELHTRILHDAEAARIDGEKRLADRLEKLDAEFAARRGALEAEIETRRAKVVDAEAELANRSKALDDRDHMHVRRDLRAHITGTLQTRLSAPPVSREAARLRRNIALYCTVAITLLVVFSAFSLWDTRSILTASTSNYVPLAYAVLRFSFPLAAAGALLVYLLNWWRRIHAEDVRSERDLERYRYDVDRASWAVETIMEAQTEGGTGVPEVWIAGATQGLFSRSENAGQDSDARDAIAALLGFSAKAKVGTEGLHVELGRGDLRRLSQEGG